MNSRKNSKGIASFSVNPVDNNDTPGYKESALCCQLINYYKLLLSIKLNFFVDETFVREIIFDFLRFYRYSL